MREKPAKDKSLSNKKDTRSNRSQQGQDVEKVQFYNAGEKIASQYLLLAERSLDIVLFLRASDAQILEANRAAEKAYGYSREELLKKNLYDLRARDTWPELTTQLQRSVEEGAFQFEGVHRRSDGTLFPIEASWSCIAQGEEHIVLSIVRDITARKQAEDQLRLVTDAIPALISYIGADYRYRFVNQTYTEWFGHRNEDIIGRSMVDVLGPADFEKLRPHVEKALSGQTEIFEAETPYKSGGTRFIRGTYTPDKAPDGTIRGIFVLVLDISENKRRERNTAFLAEISQDLSRLSNDEEIMQMVSEKTLAYLGLSRCVFTEYKFDTDEARVIFDWNSGGLPSLTGTNRHSSLITPEAESFLRAGRQVAIDDVGKHQFTRDFADKLAGMQISAVANTPYLREGIWKASLTVHSHTPRQWRDEELDLLREMCVRIWARIETVRAEADLRRSEKRLRLATDAANMFSWEIDLLHEKLIWSDNAAKVIGCLPQDLPDTLEEGLIFIMPEERIRITRIFEDALRHDQKGFDAEFRGGQGRFWHVHGLFIRENLGNPLKIIGVAQDITSRKRIEEELVASKEFFNRITDIAPTILYVYDIVHTRNVWVNRDIMNILGYSAEDVESMGDRVMTHLMHPDDLKRYESYYLDLLHLLPEEIAEFEYRMRHRNGSWVWLYSRDMAFTYAADGSVTQIVGAALDITERKRIHEALTETAGLLSKERERLDIALRTGALGVYEWQVGDDVVWWSPELYPLYGVDPAIFTPTVETFAGLIHPDDREDFWQKSAESIARAKVFTHEYRIVRPDGTISWIFNRSNVGLNAAGQVERVTGVAADITERKEFEAQLEKLVQVRTRELQQANALLEASNKELEQFAFVTSHDLQEPLRKIQTFSDLLKNKNRHLLDDTSIGHLDKIINSSNRMRNLVEDLLRFSRLSQSTEPFEPVDLTEELHHVLETYDLRIEETGATIDADPLPVIQGVAWQLHLMLANLVGNSLKFVKPGVTPRVQISSRPLPTPEVRQHGLDPARPHIEIRVADNGIGFEQEHTDKIFVIFQRLHGISEYQGTGIGLAICNKVATAHRGKIYATSAPGEGATFYVVLPVYNERGEAFSGNAVV